MMDANLQRRELLKRALAGAAGAQLAAWTAACAGDEAPPEPGDGSASEALLRTAWARARAAERPLFVLVIPADEGLRIEHGWAWGELLLRGSEATLSRLAACELVCATLPAVRAVLAGVTGVPERECTALLATPAGPGGAGARAVALEVEVRLEREPPYDEDPALEERPYRDRTARLELALAGLALDRAGDPRRLQGEPPPGAAWAKSTGCGIEVLGHPERGPLFACGMGHVPDIAQKFLHYLVSAEPSR